MNKFSRKRKEQSLGRISLDRNEELQGMTMWLEKTEQEEEDRSCGLRGSRG
jgi:hypothetical protein